MNFPARHPLQVGYHWNQPEQHPVLAEADVILVLGSDVPWSPAHNRPDPGARCYVIDVDPLKATLPLWHVPALRYAQEADLGLAAGQLAARLAARGRLDPAAVADRARAAAGRARRAAGRVGPSPRPAPPPTSRRASSRPGWPATPARRRSHARCCTWPARAVPS